MTKIVVTVLSDDIGKSKRFVNHLVGDKTFNIVRDNSDELVVEHDKTIVQAIQAHQGQRGYRHHKLYVDSASPKAVEMTLEMFQYKVLPIFYPNFSLEIKDSIEYLDFDKEIERFNKILDQWNALDSADTYRFMRKELEEENK